MTSVSTPPQALQLTLARARQAASAGQFDHVRTMLRMLSPPALEDALAQLQIAELHEACGDLLRGAHFYEQALNANPSLTPGFRGLARCCLGLARALEPGAQADHLSAPLTTLERCATADATDRETGVALGEVARALQKAGDWLRAERLYRCSLTLEPTRAQTWNDLASLLSARNQPREAERCATTALEHDAEFVPALINLGALLLQRKALDDSLSVLRRALALMPEAPIVHANLGACWLQKGELPQAIAHLREATRRSPRYVRAWLNLGTAQERSGDLENARRSYHCAAEIEPSNAKAQQNLGMLDLLCGDYSSGWQRYEQRRRLYPPQIRQRYRNPLSPEQLAARLSSSDAVVHDLGTQPSVSHQRPRLLVYAEQGLGDTIQFVRLLPKLANAYDVTLHCPPALVSWLATIALGARVVSNAESVPEHDYSIPLLSLGGALVRTESDIPAPLSARLKRASSSEPRAGSARLGIAWRGNPDHDNDVSRSLATATLSRLRIPCSWQVHSLDWAATNEELARRAAALSEVLQRPVVPALVGSRDFRSTAEVVQQLDLVVSVDTAVAHLAATLARPTWLLIPRGPDWRWGTERSDSPWYPSLRLFRQPAPGDWSSPLAAISEAFERFG